MALDVVAVETFTQGRLGRDDDETQRQLDAALAAVRNYCGWHVTPVLTNEQITLDGPGGPTLMLPTLALSEITALTEDGVELDVTTLSWSKRGMVAKKRYTPVPVSNFNLAHHYFRPWNFWSECFGGITATITHGFATAPDLEAVVLAAIDRGGFAAGDTTELKAVGPFQYDTSGLAAGAIFSDAEMAILDRYRLEKAP